MLAFGQTDASHPDSPFYKRSKMKFLRNFGPSAQLLFVRGPLRPRGFLSPGGGKPLGPSGLAQKRRPLIVVRPIRPDSSEASGRLRRQAYSAWHGSFGPFLSRATASPLLTSRASPSKPDRLRRSSRPSASRHKWLRHLRTSGRLRRPSTFLLGFASSSFREIGDFPVIVEAFGLSSTSSSASPRRTFRNGFAVSNVAGPSARLREASGLPDVILVSFVGSFGPSSVHSSSIREAFGLPRSRGSFGAPLTLGNPLGDFLTNVGIAFGDSSGRPSASLVISRHSLRSSSVLSYGGLRPPYSSPKDSLHSFLLLPREAEGLPRSPGLRPGSLSEIPSGISSPTSPRRSAFGGAPRRSCSESRPSACPLHSRRSPSAHSSLTYWESSIPRHLSSFVRLRLTQSSSLGRLLRSLPRSSSFLRRGALRAPLLSQSSTHDDSFGVLRARRGFFAFLLVSSLWPGPPAQSPKD